MDVACPSYQCETGLRRLQLSNLSLIHGQQFRALPYRISRYSRHHPWRICQTRCPTKKVSGAVGTTFWGSTAVSPGFRHLDRSTLRSLTMDLHVHFSFPQAPKPILIRCDELNSLEFLLGLRVLRAWHCRHKSQVQHHRLLIPGLSTF